MASRTSIMAGRPPVRSATVGPFTGTFKLTGTRSLSLVKYRKTAHSTEWIGIVIESDPRGSYKPSRVIDLIVDGEPRIAAFQVREIQSTLTWEVKPAV